MKKLIVGILLSIFLISCAPAERIVGSEDKDYSGKTLTTVSYSVSRFIDKDAGVVCWIRGNDGIDCLPISETKLKGE